MAQSDASNHAVEGTQPVRIENIEDTELFKRLQLTASEPSKAVTARQLALVLVWTFAGLLLASFGVGVYILSKSSSIDERTLTASTEFLRVSSSIFSPLLAFVLGYYFSKREE